MENASADKSLSGSSRPETGIPLRLGILGGGQLGRMLIQSAVNFDLECHVFDPDENAPCRNFAASFTRGNLLDEQAVVDFCRPLDLITIEIENVSVDAMEMVEELGIPVRPSSAVVRTVRDKLLQKEFFKKNGIPTSDFVSVSGISQIKEAIGYFPVVQKLRISGYDGRGVQKLSDAGDLSRAFDAPSILEKPVDIHKEISVIVSRNVSGETSVYPAVEMEFHPDANLVELLFCPADLNDRQRDEAEKLALRTATALDICGILAVEMFVTRGGEILVNEVAPRPHNSGHHTIEAAITSQFEQHLRAILDLPPGSTEMKLPSVMVNLLGESDGPVRYEGLKKTLALPGASIHLYGKKYVRPNRKMGHVTVLDETLDGARAKARFIKENLHVVGEDKDI